MKDTKENDCIFCKIVRKEIPAEIVHEDEHAVVFRDIAPKAPVHLLAVPREHIAALRDASAEAIGRTARAGIRAAEKEGLFRDGYRMVVNDGRAAGQAVWHLHLHFLGGRDLRWPPG